MFGLSACNFQRPRVGETSGSFEYHHMQRQELPQDVVAGLQRILLLDPSPADPLDTLTAFSPVDSLNALFPNGKALLRIWSWIE